MALPLAPLAALALRYGTVAIATYALARSVERGRRDQRAEDALDELPEGLTLRHASGVETQEVHAAGRTRRVIRLGTSGPGVEIDAVSLTRIRLRKV